MELNEAIKILNNANYLVETYIDEDSLYKYLDDTLKEEKIGSVQKDGNCIRVKTTDGTATVCEIVFDEDDICVNHDGKGKWFTSEQDEKDIGKFVKTLIKKMDESVISENSHFDYWQWKLRVKRLVKAIIGENSFWQSFDALRGAISWELGIDIVKDTMKKHYDNGDSPEACFEEIKELADEARMK